MIKSSFLILSVLFWTCAFGQDPVFNQTDNSRNYLNPAYTGTEKSFSADLNYRNQWPELSSNYRTLAFQMNQYLGKGNGVSIHFVNDKTGDIINEFEVGLGYAKQINIAEKHHFSIGTQISYFKKTLYWDKLTFGNMIDPRTGYVYDSLGSLQFTNPSGVDFNFGVLYHNKHFFAGYAVKHITQPNESFFGGVSKLPTRHNVELGGKVQWREIIFVPSAKLYSQGSFNTLIGALKVRWKSLEVDGGIQLENGIFGGVGFVSEKFNIGYNYTTSINGMNSSNSTHEIRMGCNFDFLNKTNEFYFDF